MLNINTVQSNLCFTTSESRLQLLSGLMWWLNCCLFIVAHIVFVFCVMALISFVVLCIFSSFANIQLEKRERKREREIERARWLLYLCCVLNVRSMLSFCVFPHSAMSCLQCVIVAFPGHNHLLFVQKA